VLFVLFASLPLLPVGQQGNQVVGLVLWMLVWWISEVVPMAVTSLLPLIILPTLGILTMDEASAPYGDKYVFLFLGGFLLALALEKWNLHRRLALTIVKKTGTSANKIILGFMVASFAISMWISNTATALMMFPIAMSVVNLLLNDPSRAKTRGERNFSTTLLLGVAYGASIGGIATLVGSPPNAATAGILESNHGFTLTFFDWLKVGFPFALTLLLVTYALLTFVLFPNRLGHFQLGKDMIGKELTALGAWTSPEKKVFLLFLITAMLWMAQEFIAPFIAPFQISDISIALTSGILLFLLPAQRGSTALLEWQDTEKLPWGILLMFGGGLSLAKAFKQSGLLDAVMHWMDQLDKTNLLTYVAILCLVGLIITALISNLAMVNIFVPVVAALAIGSGQSPELFAIPVAISASCDFMFPMSTPPNAIAYSSGHIKAMDMFRAGMVLNVAAFLLLLSAVYLILRYL
jgi:sodium-dependent dicarboxylate transporter 2/3/5